MDKEKANGIEYEFTVSGGIRMLNAKTIGRYHELKSEHPKSDNYGVFFAFGEEQFEKGRQRLICKGYLKEDEKVCSAGMGMYGTRSEISRYLDFYKERGKMITAECNPQEVYFYEFNNHECMVTMDDDDALKVVIEYFGNEAAHKIQRVYEGTPTNILAPLTERDKHLGEYNHTLDMLARMECDMQGFFSSGDCRYHRPDSLWGRCIKSEIDKMHELYRELPDDIKDASPLSKEEIDDYTKRLQEWADEEFSKPEYNPVQRTKRKDLPKEIYLGEKLYYQDDDGKLQVPDRIWFSHDSRRCHSDDRKRHGRAMTSYMGKNGTTLTPVFYVDLDHGFIHRQLVREDLCDVSCKYTYTPWIKGVGVGSVLSDFYYE